MGAPKTKQTANSFTHTAGHPFEDQKFDVADQETWYEVVIRYGLYLGAVFQMACIMVVCNTILGYIF